MTAAPALPLTVIVEKLAGDAELGAIIAAEASEILRPSVAADLAVMKAQVELRDRLATRHAELRTTADAIAADLALGRLGLLP
jgi:hypothetical protein